MPVATQAAESPFEAGFGARVASDSLEAHAIASRGWNIEYAQLGRGRFRGELTYTLTADTQYAVNAFTPGMITRGSAPRGTLILGACLDGTAPSRFAGQSISDAHVLLVRPDEAFDLHAPGPDRIFTATLQPHRVDAFCVAVLGRPLEELARHGVLAAELAPGERRRHLERLGVFAVLGCMGALADPVAARQFEEKLLHALTAGLRVPPERSRLTQSLRIARRADDFLRTHLDRPVTIADLCAATGATERTLHHAFRQHFHSSPKAYLKLLRLNAAHRELARGAPGTTVTGVAMRWGFFHPGWFSHDYRRMFDCSPTETLRAARRAPASAVFG